MARFDTEDLLDAVQALIAANLNTKIAAIETEKNAKGKTLNPALVQIAANAYFRQTWSDQILNRNPAVFYGIEDSNPIQKGPEAAMKYDVFAEVLFVSNGDTKSTQRMERYARAMKEIFEENPLPSECGQLSVKIVKPESFQMANSSEELKACGIILTASLF